MSESYLSKRSRFTKNLEILDEAFRDGLVLCLDQLRISPILGNDFNPVLWENYSPAHHLPFGAILHRLDLYFLPFQDFLADPFRKPAKIIENSAYKFSLDVPLNLLLLEAKARLAEGRIIEALNSYEKALTLRDGLVDFPIFEMPFRRLQWIDQSIIHEIGKYYSNFPARDLAKLREKLDRRKSRSRALLDTLKIDAVANDAEICGSSFSGTVKILYMLQRMSGLSTEMPTEEEARRNREFRSIFPVLALRVFWFFNWDGFIRRERIIVLNFNQKRIDAYQSYLDGAGNALTRHDFNMLVSIVARMVLVYHEHRIEDDLKIEEDYEALIQSIQQRIDELTKPSTH